MSVAAESTDSPEFLIRHAAGVACRLLVAFVVVVMAAGRRAGAQQPGPRPVDSISPDKAEFLPRTNFHLTANSLSGGDPADSPGTRTTAGAPTSLDYHLRPARRFVGDYEAVVGSELRTSTPTRASTFSRRPRPGVSDEDEFALVFHHVSRHLSDRPKPLPTAWNVLEARYLRNFDFSGTTIALVAAAGNVVTHVDVDYTWNLNFDVDVRRAVKPRLDVYARGLGDTFGVDPAIKGRTQAQHSGRSRGGRAVQRAQRRARVVCRRRAPHGRGFTRLPAADVGHHGIPPGEQVSWGIMPERTPR